MKEKAPRLCVRCRAHPVIDQWRPFCSKRCKLLDLGDWVDGKYRVPDEDTDTGLETSTTDTGD